MWDERYSQNGYLFGTEPADFLKNRSDLLSPGLTALAVADGEGRNSVFLAQHGVETTAFDASPVALAKAKALAGAQKVRVDYHVAEMERWPWQRRAYDLVVAIFIQFLAPTAMAHAFQGMQQALRPGGRILLHGYRPEQLEYRTGGPPEVENLYTEELLRQAFEGLDIERLASYDAEIREGTGHVGRSALIDLVARKL
ncbi:MAG: class I SAM-dependent methyltransferase [Acidobacteriota bacterium]